ncbi:MAG TPA: T9SS type A sorting domain-containing protein [Saprospiraceae bacterium]|nr:T9SS type A sorting domain-containing protein [Saprospiraceae bacterium]
MKINRIISLLILLVLLLLVQRTDAQCNIVLDAVVMDESCFGMQDGGIDLTYSGGAAPYQFEWSNGETNEDLFTLVPGTYTVTVSYGAGCSATLSRTVEAVPEVLFSYLNDDGIISCQNPTTEITATATGGTEPYTFEWSNGVFGNVLSSAVVQTYTVTVTDAHGCTVTSQGSVSMSPTYPVADAGPDEIFISCATAPNLVGGSGTSQGPDFAYEWSTFTGGFDYGVDIHQPVIEITQFGFYTFTVTSLVEGCSVVDHIVVWTDNTFPQISIVPPANLSCNQSQVVIEAPNTSTGPQYTYEWTTPNGHIVSGGNTLQVTVDAPGLYELKVTDNDLGCSRKNGVTVIESFAVDAGPDQGLPCGNGQVTLSGTAPNPPGSQFTYLWTSANGNIVSGANTLNPVVDQAGDYLLTVTNTLDGCTKTDVMTVHPGTLVPAQDISILDVSCTGQLGGIWLNMNQGQAPYDYEWSNGSGQPALINITVGTYTATITDALGCQYYAEAEVKDTSTITVDLDVTHPTCQNPFGGAIDLTVTGIFGPFEYQWSTGDTAQDLSGLGEGPHTVTITYAGGTCSDEYSVNLTSGLSFTLSTQVTHTTCTNQNDGAIDLTVGGTFQAPLQYFWSTGAGTQDIQNLLPGTYSVTVQDASGCTASVSALVKLGYGLAVTANITNANCGVTCDGVLDITVTSGLPPYTYQWSSGEPNQDIFNKCSGTYTVTVADAAGCTITANFNIQQGASNLDLILTPTDASCNGNDGAITLTVFGGQPAYSFNWSNGSIAQNIAGLVSGLYTVTVTEAFGCTNSASIFVGQTSAMTLSATTQDASCAGGCNGSVDLTVNGTGPFSYFWSDGYNQEDPPNLCSGVYTVTVSDGQGCTKTLSVTIQDNTTMVVTGVVTPVLCSGANTGAIDLSVTGGTPGYTFDWNQGSNTEDIGNLAAGTYTVTVTDQLNCTITQIFQVPGSSAIQVNASVSPNICFGTSQGWINLTTAGGNPGYVFDWVHIPGGNNPDDLNNLAAGTYTVTVTDASGCTQSATAVVSESQPLQLSGVVANPLCSGGATGSVNLTVTGGTVPYVYAWSVGLSGPVFSNAQDPANLAADTYKVVVTDAGGCTASDVYTLTDPAPLQFSIVSLANNCVEETLSGPALPGATYAWMGPNNFTAATQVIAVSAAGPYILTLSDANGCSATAQYVVNLLASGSCGAIEGKLYYDTDESCTYANNEAGLAGWIVRAEGAADTLYSVTDANGHYRIDVPLGVYAVKILVPNGLWGICSNAVPVDISSPGQIVAGGDFAAQAMFFCPSLEVNLGVDKLRRCFDNNFYQVQYCNKGTQKADDAFVTVALDPFLTPVGASMPYTDLGSNVVRFEVGDVAVGDCGSISLEVFVNCNAVLGQTHCTEASAYPDTLCMPPGAGWSGASLQVSSICLPDSLRFIITNQGGGNMTTGLNYIVVEDGVMFRSSLSNPMAANEVMEVTVPANGSTWRLEVAQEPNHPSGAERVGLSVEGCTSNSSFSTGFVNQFPQSDEAPALDRNCTPNKGSFDPNDKHSDPVGFGVERFVRPGTEIEYKIRFQNTGTDTAFTVRILDTLSSWLDPASIRFGASSHPYQYNLTGEGVVHFHFNDIALPDSNTNEAASHGFVVFTIRHRADAPLETLIENKASIYFDFNEPIVTNTTWLRLDTKFLTVSVWQPNMPLAAIKTSPNPFRDETLLEISGLEREGNLRLQVFDLNGMLLEEQESSSSSFQLQATNWPTGLYTFRVLQSGKLVGAGKLVVQE